MDHGGGNWLPSPHSPESECAGLERCWPDTDKASSASEGERPALTEWALYAKFYAKLLCGFILTLPYAGGYYFHGRSHANLTRPHWLSWKKNLQTRGHTPCIFLCRGVLPVKPNFWNVVSQVGPRKQPQSCCTCVCLHRWGRPGMQVYQLARETCRCSHLSSSTQRNEGAWRRQVQGWTFEMLLFPLIKATRKPVYCIHQLAPLFLKYLLSPCCNSHLKGELFLKGGIWNIKWGIRTLSLLSENSGVDCEIRYKSLQSHMFQKPCRHKKGNAHLGPNGSKEVWQRDNELILAEWMLFSRCSGKVLS